MMHDFDEFFGKLYRLKAEEEPEHEDYPTRPDFRKKRGPRGVIESWLKNRQADTADISHAGQWGDERSVRVFVADDLDRQRATLKKLRQVKPSSKRDEAWPVCSKISIG